MRATKSLDHHHKKKGARGLPGGYSPPSSRLSLGKLLPSRAYLRFAGTSVLRIW